MTTKVVVTLGICALAMVIGGAGAKVIGLVIESESIASAAGFCWGVLVGNAAYGALTVLLKGDCDADL